VIVNLLLNACQASRHGQSVVVNLRAESDATGRPAAIIEVVDQGEGMSDAVLADVFKPFFTTKVNGGGLGLTLCRETMARMGGSIVVSSEPGVGTTVTLTFPQ
jgi:signal transduction histidine kinase